MLTLALVLSLAQTPQHRLFMQPNLPRVSYAFFEFAPANGAGMGTACACGNITGAKGETLTFTRASSAWCTLDNYSLVSCSTNQPRVMTGTGGTSPLGILGEDAATNLILHNRDLSQAIWTKVNMACPRTSTGADGVAASASTCTASAANGTAIQATVTGAATRNSSLYIRRRTGTGVVEVTRDNGATWTAITASLSGSLFKRVVSTEAIGCAYGGCIVVPAMTSGIANPTVGIRVVTSSDAVDVDLVQDETNDFPSSPVTSAGTAGVRAVETATVAVPGLTIASLGHSVMRTGSVGGAGTAAGQFASGSNFFLGSSASWTAGLGSAEQCYAFSGAGSIGTTTVFAPPLGPVPVTCALTSGSSMATAVMGVSTATATAATVQTITNFVLINGAYGPLNGLVSQVCADPVSGRCVSAPRAHQTSIAWVGDSITRGDAAAPSRAPWLLGKSLSRTVANAGINAQTAAGCATVATSIMASGAQTLVMLCGVNDLAAGSTAVSIMASLEPALNAAKAAGKTVVPVLPTPWASVATWTAAKQTQTDALKTLLQAWCTANSSTCVSTDSLGTGSPLVLAVGFDSGDGLHPNAAGAAALAALVQAANP